jgi:ribosome maturation protein SDO1
MYQLPVSKVKLTNVAVVKLQKGSKRFEIACYRNKVLNYRQGIETDLSEVLQTDRIFTNAQKGEFANQKDLSAVFGTTDQATICQFILQNGHVQVSDLERSQQSAAMLRSIATQLSETCISPKDGRSYTLSQIQHAMKEAEYAVHPTRSLKKQTMDCLKKMQAVLPIVRAKMELLLTFTEEEELVNRNLIELQIVPTVATDTSVTVLVDPSLYRPLEDLMIQVNGKLEILRQVVKEGGGEAFVEQEEEVQEEKSIKPTTAAVEQLALKNDSDDDDDDLPVNSRRATQKKQQKQSKKAKRRDREEAVERQERMAAETKRREEREGVAVAVPADGAATASSSETPAASDKKACNTCGGSFTATEYRAHFKSDWHRYNQKLLLKGMSAVSQVEFELCDADFLS